MENLTMGVDVGLKTLSICVLSIDKIYLWGVYNTIEETQKCKTCGRNSKYTDLTCGIHRKGPKIKKHQIKTKKIKYHSLQELCDKILDSLFFLISENSVVFDSVKNIVIELQPRFNPKMTFASHVIFTKLCDYYRHMDINIKFEKASKKLTNYKGGKRVFVKNTYTNRKKKSIEYVLDCLDNYEGEYLEYFVDLKKKDDASDSFLLAFNNLT